MFTVIGPNACLSVKTFTNRTSIKLEHIQSGHKACIYRSEISHGKDTVLYCELYKDDKSPKTSPEVIMKIFCQRVRKIRGGDLDGIIDMTDVFSQTDAVKFEKHICCDEPLEMESPLVDNNNNNNEEEEEESGNEELIVEAVEKIEDSHSSLTCGNLSEKMQPNLSDS